MNALDLVKTYLTTRQQQGITRLPVDEDARRILRAWMLAAKRGKRSAAEAPPPNLPPTGFGKQPRNPPQIQAGFGNRIRKKPRRRAKSPPSPSFARPEKASKKSGAVWSACSRTGNH